MDAYRRQELRKQLKERNTFSDNGIVYELNDNVLHKEDYRNDVEWKHQDKLEKYYVYATSVEPVKTRNGLKHITGKFEEEHVYTLLNKRNGG